MIYAYKYLPWRIDDFNMNIVYFFEQLFNHCPEHYDENLLLRQAFIPMANNSPVRLRNHFEAITEAYWGLEEDEKEVVRNTFELAKDIEKLCSDTSIDFLRFEQLPARIGPLLKTFTMSLWEDYPQNNMVSASYGTVQDHFNAFASPDHQSALICPFCGLHKLKPANAINRDAYDHYIPKAFYPFISVNFMNLSPICHECNGDEKHSDDTLYKDGIRRRIFYPFDETFEKDQLSIKIIAKEKFNPVNLKTLLSNIQWDYVIKYAGSDDSRTQTWDEIFKIKRRYRENILIYQTIWHEMYLRVYKRETTRGKPFRIIIDDLMEDTKYKMYNSPLGILQYIYFSFFISIDNLEEKLMETTFIRD